MMCHLELVNYLNLDCVVSKNTHHTINISVTVDLKSNNLNLIHIFIF